MPDRPLVDVVDDDQAMRDSLEFLLETGGFAVRLYDSAQPFLDCLLDLAPGCILTDIRMPDIDDHRSAGPVDVSASARVPDVNASSMGSTRASPPCLVEQARFCLRRFLHDLRSF